MTKPRITTPADLARIAEARRRADAGEPAVDEVAEPAPEPPADKSAAASPRPGPRPGPPPTRRTAS